MSSKDDAPPGHGPGSPPPLRRRSPRRALPAARPEGTVTVAHGLTPGGNVDVTARLMADRLGVRLGQSAVVVGAYL